MINWFPIVTDRADARHKVFCLHHAGGSTFAYRNWIDSRIPVNFQPVELPGRGYNADLPCREDFGPLMDELAAAIHGRLKASEPFSLFGHSMGAAMAFALECILERVYSRTASAVIVAARHCVNAEDPGLFRIHMGDGELLNEMKKMNPEQAELYDQPEFQNYFLPIIHHDYQLHENYHYDRRQIRPVIYAHAGLSDPDYSPQIMHRWGEVTSGEARVEAFEGDHFFVQKLGNAYRDRVVQIIQEVTAG